MSDDLTIAASTTSVALEEALKKVNEAISRIQTGSWRPRTSVYRETGSDHFVVETSTPASSSRATTSRL
jgi:hypothetical protein